MADREITKEIIDGLRCATGDPMPCAKCRYREYMYSICKRKCAEDAIALLKAQQPHVMTLNEMNDKRGRGEAVYYEDRDATCKSQDVFVVAPDKDLDVVWLKAETYTLAAKMSTMGKTWRCWTSRPGEERRIETPWEN